MSAREHFFARALHGSLPLLVWAAHFFASYVLVAAQCSPALMTPDGPSMWLLALMSAAGLGVCAVLLWRAWQAVRKARAAGREPALTDWAAFGSSVLALVGIAWTTLPLLMLEHCG